MHVAPPVLYPFCKHVLLGPVVRRRVDLEVSGVENIPARGPVIIAANHLAEVDSLILPLSTRRQLSFFAKSEYFTGSGIRGLLSRWFLTGTGQIRVDRSGDDGALAAAEQVLTAGGAWAIYPEGTRSPDGRLHRGHTGALRVARRVPGTLVVPVALSGTAEVNPPGTRRMVPGRVTVRIGVPLPVSDLVGADADIRSGTDRLMATIRTLGGLDYVDEYAQR
ncbi:1-acyl-sn-glycerol-3-phosphate acyltransferase [Gordonia sp. HY366]|uniref:1-acyl-sn-glycerol-3-phosphate acyltransferase n=1 Tax=Gordonia liuliyuniae TaxID=2911517 RepID=A0ABS9IS42_9ACTN|nr:1-acyl-sn-glycerol-3-phosphate acyltransferase [Gordonia liuliyuniae]